MNRLEIIKKYTEKFKVKKSSVEKKIKGGFKGKEGKVLNKEEQELALKNGETVKGVEAQNITCYVVQDDLLLVGDRATLEARIGKKVGIAELDARTNAKLEGVAKVINENYKKGATATVKGEAGAKASAKLGKHVETSAEIQVATEATAMAMVDLTRLMAELGVNVKSEIKVDGHIKLDLKVIEIDAYVGAGLTAEAMANVGISWKGVKAEAKASAQASATAGVKMSTRAIKIKGHKFELLFRPSITAYARAEAKAAAAAGLQTGVTIGAAAAIGLRGAIEAGIRGDYTTTGTNEFDREINEKEKSEKIKNEKIKDLGVVGAEIEAELSVGAAFSASPFELKTEKREGIQYGVASGTIKVNVPGIISGPAGVGVGIKVYVSVLLEIANDVIDNIKAIIKEYILNELAEVLNKVYKEFEKEVKHLKQNVQNFGLEIIVNLLDFIGEDLSAIDVELKRRDKSILFLNEKYVDTRADNTVTSTKLLELKKELEEEFNLYNVYVEKTFKVQQDNIDKFLKSATEKVTKLELEKDASKIKKVRKKAKEKTEKTIDRLKELKNTKLMFEFYLRTNDLELDSSILEKAQDNIKEMEKSIVSLENFVKLVS